MHIHVQVQRPEGIIVWCPALSFSTYSFEAGFLPEPEAYVFFFFLLGWNPASLSKPPIHPPPPGWTHRLVQDIRLVLWVLGSELQAS